MNTKPSWKASTTFSYLPRFIFCVLLLAPITCSCLPAPGPIVYKIGLVAPFEGEYRSVGYDAIYAARMAIRVINANSLQQGWALELVAYDDRAEPEMARVTAHNLAVDADILVVIGHYTYNTTAIASEIYHTAGIPLIILGEGPAATTFWHSAPSPQKYVQEILRVASADIRSAAVWGKGDLAAELAQQLRAQDINIVSTNPEKFSTIPEVIFSTLSPLKAAKYMLNWYEKGWQGQFISTTNLHSSGFDKVIGDLRDNACFMTPYPLPDDVSDTASWKYDYLNTGPHVPEPGIFALPTYDIIFTLADVIAKEHHTKKPITRQQFNEEMINAHHNGKLGLISWDASGYWTHAPLYWYCWDMTALQLMKHIP